MTEMVLYPAALLELEEKFVEQAPILYERWLDEKEYEDWEDYEKVMRGWLPPEVEFHSSYYSSRSGLCLIVRCEGALFRFRVNENEENPDFLELVLERSR